MLILIISIIISRGEVTDSNQPTIPIIPPKVSKTYFDKNLFAQCAAFEFLNAGYNHTTFIKKLEEITKNRRKLSGLESQTWGDCAAGVSSGIESSVGVQVPGAVALGLSPIGCKMNEMVANVEFHSTPLLVGDLANQQGRDVNPSKSSFFDKLYVATNDIAKTKKTNTNDFDGEKLRAIVAQTKEAPFMRYIRFESATPVIEKAEPLVNWLLDQKKKSVSHFALFKKANSIYKDPFVSLAVIGTLFDEERKASDRMKACVLGNRMKPLLVGDQADNIGYNYRFWANLNVVLTDSALLARGANYIFEWGPKGFDGRKGDHGDYSANEQGIRQSLSILKETRLLLSVLSPTKPTNKLNCDI